MRNTSIAENIAAGRRELGITQAALAERVGVTKAAVSKWELGQSLPDVAMLPRLASQLGVTLDELIGYGQELSDEEVSAIVREATGLSLTDRDAAVARCERELRDHGSSWNLLVAVAGLYAGWATTARAAGEEGARRSSAVGPTSSAAAWWSGHVNRVRPSMPARSRRRCSCPKGTPRPRRRCSRGCSPPAARGSICSSRGRTRSSARGPMRSR